MKMMSERDRLELRRVVNLLFEVGAISEEQYDNMLHGIRFLFEKNGYYVNFN